MKLTGYTVDSQGNVITDAWYYKSDAAGNVLSKNIYIPSGEFSFDIDENDNLVFYRWARPGYTTAANQAFGNGGYLSQNNPFTVRFATADKPSSILPIAGAGLALLLLAGKKKSVHGVGKLEVKDVTPYILIGGVLVATGIIKKLLVSIGLMDSADTKALDQTSVDPGSFWNPNYYKQFTSYSYSLTKEQAVNDALAIIQAFGIFNDDEEAVINIFHQLQTKAEVSYLADIFQQMNGQDLLTWLRGGTWPDDRLSDADVQKINQFISLLPTN